MSLLKRLYRKIGRNPLDRILKKAQNKGRNTFLIFWNRGLGDIALGLYAIVHRIHTYIPDAKITVATRSNLVDGFTLLGGVEVRVIEGLKRGDPIQLQDHIDLKTFDVVLENPNPTHWVQWQLGNLIPKLHWNKEWDQLCETFDLDPNQSYVGAHVQTETSYGHWRNWPIESWHALFEKITQGGKKVLLFGFEQVPEFDIPGVIDLRGKTPLFSLLSIIKNRCEALIVPDSGVSSMVYYLQEEFPIKHISLWAETNMGILKQNVPSPNRLLQSIAILGKDKNIANITVDEVYGHLQ